MPRPVLPLPFAVVASASDQEGACGTLFLSDRRLFDRLNLCRFRGWPSVSRLGAALTSHSVALHGIWGVSRLRSQAQGSGYSHRRCAVLFDRQVQASAAGLSATVVRLGHSLRQVAAELVCQPLDVLAEVRPLRICPQVHS